MGELHKRWYQYTDAEIQKTKNEKCKKCKYGKVISGSTTGHSTVCCDYICMTGCRRGCRPEECTRFKEKK